MNFLGSYVVVRTVIWFMSLIIHVHVYILNMNSLFYLCLLTIDGINCLFSIMLVMGNPNTPDQYSLKTNVTALCWIFTVAVGKIKNLKLSILSNRSLF